MKKIFLFLSLICSGICFCDVEKCKREEHLHVYDIGSKLHPYSESSFFLNQEPLNQLLSSGNIRVVIEVGSWYGESTMFIAERLPDKGRVYAIDSWIGYPREIYENTLNVYERFLSNVIHRQLTEKIIPIRNTSLSAAQNFSHTGEMADMIYIDCDHGYYAVYSDLVAWSIHLKPAGILCGNLYSSVGETRTIQEAIQDYCKDHKKTFEFSDNFWVIK